MKLAHTVDCVQEKGVIERKVNKIKEITGGTGHRCNIMIRF